MRRPDELLYDSEACLRLIDHVIEELGSSHADVTRFAAVSSVGSLAKKPADSGEADIPSITDRGRALRRVTR